jgi:hypothetical protein
LRIKVVDAMICHLGLPPCLHHTCISVLKLSLSQLLKMLATDGNFLSLEKKEDYSINIIVPPSAYHHQIMA